jgi:uncharacterized phage infection (PIP) family protein YhgE
LSDSKVVTLEDRIQKLESDIKELKTELSITLENFGEIREFLSELTQLSKNKTELLEDRPKGLLEFDSVPSSPKSKLDTMIERCVSNIIKDYRESFKER